MDWNIKQISIPVFDLEKSKEFYQFLLCNEIYDENKIPEPSNEYYIFGGNIKLRLYKLRKINLTVII